MTKALRKVIAKQIKKALSNTGIRAIVLTLLFTVSGVGASLLINPAGAVPNTASPNPAGAAQASPSSLAPAPLSQAEANWAYPNGNAFGQDYNPQNQINSSNAQDLGLSWIYPLPAVPTSLSTVVSVSAEGAQNMPLIVNGTAIVMTQFDEVIAFNVANGNILWTFQSPLAPNQTLGLGSGPVSTHAHDGTEQFTTATFGSGVSGPTFWFNSGNDRVYAISAITGKLELSFNDWTGLSMVSGNSPDAVYPGAGPSNIVINQRLGILVNSMGAATQANSGRSFFAGWDLNNQPPSLKWVTYTTPPQPGGNLPLNPYFAEQQIANMTGAATFFPGKGSTNGYTTPAEVAGGVLHNVNDSIVVNWKTMSQAQLNASLYDDWGQVHQSSQCAAITGGQSTGTTAAGWGGQWIVGSGQSSGMVFVGTNNKDPYVGPCNPGPDLWSAATLALNMTTGQIIWGFQNTAHDIWDYDCSWYWGMANETINGVNTEVILKTCKDGYYYMNNALTGNLIWAWSPPSGTVTKGAARCPVCYLLNPLNKTQMSIDYGSALTNCAPAFTTACITGPQPPFLMSPSNLAGFEDEQAYDPVTNQIYSTSHLVPQYQEYLQMNSSTYTSSVYGRGMLSISCPTCGPINDNASVWDINAATGQIVWQYSAPPLSYTGFRGQVDVSGNIVYVTLSSGDILMLDATKGTLVRDYYMSAPMDVGVSIGASLSGQMFLLIPIGTCGAGAISTCPGTTPGDIVALSLTSQAQATSTTTATVVSTTTATSTVTSVSTVTNGASGQPSTVTVTASGASGGGISPTITYGIAAVAVIFIIATGFFAMRGRKPTS